MQSGGSGLIQSNTSFGHQHNEVTLGNVYESKPTPNFSNENKSGESMSKNNIMQTMINEKMGGLNQNQQQNLSNLEDLDYQSLITLK